MDLLLRCEIKIHHTNETENLNFKSGAINRQ
jgi:hypothetical protein